MSDDKSSDTGQSGMAVSHIDGIRCTKRPGAYEEHPAEVEMLDGGEVSGDTSYVVSREENCERSTARPSFISNTDSIFGPAYFSGRGEAFSLYVPFRQGR